jgi:hypothetical protein
MQREPSPSHDLLDFMRGMSAEMAAEYQRIRKRAAEDPGTAGDQGEENWAQLLRDWLPSTYHVVTKGRILGQDGAASPQVDVLVLKGSYPPKLLNKKLYLAAGVSAAFECKITLRAAHIAEAVSNCTKIKSLFPVRTGTPFRELHSPIVYGLLAHSHSWTRDSSTPEETIAEHLIAADKLHVSHPRSQLDLFCVADLAAWTSFTVTFVGPSNVPGWSTFEPLYGPAGSATTSFVGGGVSNLENTTPIGALVSGLVQRLAWEDPSLRELADYYRLTRMRGAGEGDIRTWDSSIYSSEVRPRIEAGMLGNGPDWDEWNLTFP